MIVADATALIVLSKIGHLLLLRRIHSSVLVGPIVKMEAVDRGFERGAAEVGFLEQAMKDEWLTVARLTPGERASARRLIQTSRLDDGEAEALAIAKSRKIGIVIDDKEARTLAAALGIDHMGTAGVLLAAYAKGFLDLHELEDAVSALSRVFWLSPAVVMEIMRRARGMK